MPRLIVQVDETLEADGEERAISGFAFQVRIERLPGDTEETETALPALIPVFARAVKQALDEMFGTPAISLLAPLPPDGADPLPTLDAIIGKYRAERDAFPLELDSED